MREPRCPRDHNTRMRTRVVCKAKLFGNLSGLNLFHSLSLLRRLIVLLRSLVCGPYVIDWGNFADADSNADERARW